jgi:hypothetical protein
VLVSSSIADFVAHPPPTDHAKSCYGIIGRCPKCGNVIMSRFVTCQNCGWIVNEKELKPYSS